MALFITDQGEFIVLDSSFDSAVAGTPSGAAQASTTVNLLTSETTAQKQAKIDAVQRAALPGVVTTFQFQDGTHSETAPLKFQGFTHPIEVYGNASDNSLSTTKSVKISSTLPVDFSGCLQFDNCSAEVRVRYIEQIVPDTNGVYGLLANACQSVYVFYCSSRGSGKVNDRGCYYFDLGTTGFVRSTYVSNMAYGVIASSNSKVYSLDVPSTGTNPDYGLQAAGNGAIGKSGTQPTGAIANETSSGGGVIR